MTRIRPSALSGPVVLAAVAALLAASAPGCKAAEQPPHFRVLVLEGTPYERGFQHGERFSSEIRSIYTQMLTASILPYLNRERPDLAGVLTLYQDEAYDEGRFSFQLMLESAETMSRFIPGEYLEEMQGVADGAGLPFEQILVLNTFVDTMLTLRTITFFIRGMEAPYLARVSFEGALESDGIDNDGDGEVDEPGEGVVEPYGPSPRASMVEVPTDASVSFLLVDQGGAADVLGIGEGREPEGVDPETVRLQVDTEIVVAGDPGLSMRPVTTEGGREGLEVTFAPPGGFEPARVMSMLLQAGDRSAVTDPPPTHARFMRDERIVFTTEGYGAAVAEVENRGERDGRTQPPGLSLGLRGSATRGGETLLAHHFTLLDANTAHRHTVLFVHRPDEGIPHVVLGWTGMVWGVSGMNAEGLALGLNPSDTLDNGMVVDVVARIGNLATARLVTPGTPGGVIVRELLARTTTAQDAADLLAEQTRTFGWNFGLADRHGDLLVAEVDADILGAPDGGIHVYGPGDGEELWARSSVGPDDVRSACHFVSNAEDFDLAFIRPQRYWSTFYLRSLRAYYLLGDRVAERYGTFDVPSLVEVMREEDLADQRDSMAAAVFEPAAGRLHVAMGRVPATDAEFLRFEMAELLGREASR